MKDECLKLWFDPFSNNADTNDNYTAGENYQLGLDPNVGYADPMILHPPLDQQGYVGSSISFNVLTGGSLPLSYQWNFNGNSISGATDSVLTFASMQLTNAGEYSVTVTSTNGSVTSQSAALSVLSDFALAIQPGCAVGPGRSAMLSVSSVVSIGTSYQWYFDASPITGATASSYIITNAQQTNAGYYSVSVNGASPTNLIAYFGVLEGPPPPVANPDIISVQEDSWWQKP